MKFIDTHAHYDDRWFDEDRYEVLDRILSDKCVGNHKLSVDIPTCEFSETYGVTKMYSVR